MVRVSLSGCFSPSKMIFEGACWTNEAEVSQLSSTLGTLHIELLGLPF